jgi:hypothetical protein
MTYLRLDQDQINEQHHKVMLDIFVCEALAARALRQAHALAQGTVIGLGVGGVQCVHWEAAFYAYRHWTAGDMAYKWEGGGEGRGERERESVAESEMGGRMGKVVRVLLISWLGSLSYGSKTRVKS